MKNTNKTLGRVGGGGWGRRGGVRQVLKRQGAQGRVRQVLHDGRIKKTKKL